MYFIEMFSQQIIDSIIIYSQEYHFPFTSCKAGH